MDPNRERMPAVLRLEDEDELMSSASTPFIDAEIKGTIAVPVPESLNKLDTLDEPVSTTLIRDLKAVMVKFAHVAVPRRSAGLLNDWDLWGPLLICIYLSVLLQHYHGTANQLSDGGPEFAQFFVVFWLGSVVVTLNAQLLKANLYFFQSICLLGYCTLPLALALTICKVLLLFANNTAWLFTIRCILVLLAYCWSVFASFGFLSNNAVPNRKALVVYPMLLFYFVIGWVVLSHS